LLPVLPRLQHIGNRLQYPQDALPGKLGCVDLHTDGRFFYHAVSPSLSPQ
jgi:hypothetical protein